MPWFRVDDNLAFHHKTLAAGNGAMGLWVRAGSACASQLTDGFVTDRMAATLGTPAQARRLVEVGLWEEVEGGFVFHEWADRQPTRGEVEAERVAARDRMKAVRARKKGVKSDASPQVSAIRSGEQQAKFGRSSEEVRDVFGNPIPTHPYPTHAEGPAEPDTFEEWWAAWPRKEAKAKAKPAYLKALKVIEADKLLRLTAEWFEARPKAVGEFVPLATSWLNARRWEDERPTSHAPATTSNWDRLPTAAQLRAQREAGEA